MLVELAGPVKAQLKAAVQDGRLTEEEATAFVEWLPLILTIAQIVLDWLKNRRLTPPPAPEA